MRLRGTLDLIYPVGGGGVVADRVADVPHLAVAHGFVEYGAQLRRVKLAIADGVILVQVDVVGSKRFERAFKLPHDSGGGGLVDALEMAGEDVAELGGDDPVFALAN